MAKEKKVVRVRVTPWIDEEIADKLDALAGKLGWTRNEVAEWVIRQGVSNLDGVVKNFVATVLGAGRGVELTSSAGNKREVSGGNA